MHPRFTASMSLAQEELDFQLSPSRSAKDAAGDLARMVARTEIARADPAITSRIDIAYGTRPRQRLDLYHPASAQNSVLPCLVFIHGGFWQEGDKSVSGFAAKTFCDLGWAYVSIGYTLTPHISLTALTEEIYQALACLNTNASGWGIDPQRIVLAGHSAGGHLAACVLADVLDRGIGDRLAGTVLISGVFELAPIAKSYVNDMAGIDAREMQILSPLRHVPASDTPVHVLIGAEEPEAFHLQSDVLRDVWAPHLSQLTSHVAPGRDHFDVLEELNDPTSPTMRAINAMV